MSISDHLAHVRSLVGHTLLSLPAVAAVVEDAHGLVLLRHAEHGRWVLPGGAVEPAEHPADAVVREVHEETGLEVRPTRILAVHGGAEHQIRYRNGDEVAYVTTVFACERLGGRLRAGEHETLELGTFPRRRAADLDLAPWVRRVLALDGGGPDFVGPTRGPAPG